MKFFLILVLLLSGNYLFAKDEDGFTIENSLSVRDPFSRPDLKSADAIDQGGTVEPLQRFDLEKFKLVGVITGPKKNKAMLSDPDGKMHIVSEQAIIGTRRGKITRIAPKLILVEEKVVNLLGQEERVETKISMDEKKLRARGAL